MKACEECKKEIPGAWGVVIFPDFSKGWCSTACWRIWSEKKNKPVPGPIPRSRIRRL